MAVKIDFYDLVLRFPRLFPDPVLFEDSSHLVNRYLVENGLSKNEAGLVYQSTEEIQPVDDRGNPSATSGTAKYPFEGKTILAEYMSDANVALGYADFGTSMTPNDHSNLWTKGKLGNLRFGLREFKHQSQTLNLPEVSQLYELLKARMQPNALSTVELEGVPGQLFKPVLRYIEDKLRSSAEVDGLEVEVYAGRELSASERAALERRLTRQSGKSTLFIILSRDRPTTPIPHDG